MAFRCSQPRIAWHYKKQRAGCGPAAHWTFDIQESIWPSYCSPAVDTVIPILQLRELQSQMCRKKRWDFTLGYFLHAFVLSRFSPVRFFVTPWTVALQAPLPMGFSRQEYCIGQPFSSPRDLPNPGIKPMTPALQADSLPLSHQGSPYATCILCVFYKAGILKQISWMVLAWGFSWGCHLDLTWDCSPLRA